jgi:hypothetical protein
MKSLTSCFCSTERAFLIVLVTSLFGCSSTPQHTNVMVFGTNTKIALDVSQDATSGVGVTLGYKRQEAVWMPLLPNQAPATAGKDLQPSACTSPTACPKFEGVDSTRQTDTYSVLASFGSKLGGGVDSEGKKAEVTGEIAQYFATGLAARLLAQSGGARLVNTNGNAVLSATEKAEIADKEKTIGNELQELLVDLADKTDPKNVDAARRDAALAKSPGKDIPDARQKRIKNAKTLADLRTVITAYPHDSVAKPMLDTLNAK